MMYLDETGMVNSYHDEASAGCWAGDLGHEDCVECDEAVQG
jgi:hypothetical protein